MKTARRNDLGLALIAGATLLLGFRLVLRGDGVLLPGGESLDLVCWFRHLAGIDCPLCGMTRSFVALLDGSVVQSVSFHPAGPFLAAGTVAVLVTVLILAISGRPPLSDRRGFGVALSAVGAGCLGLWVVRLFLGFVA